MKKLLFLLLLSNISFAQITIKGTVLDKATGTPVPYARIGIKGKAAGTLSNENGKFELVVKAYTETDSVSFSSIGYKSISYSLQKAKQFTDEKIYLTEEAVNLNELTVKPKKTFYKVLGNKKYSSVECYFSGIDSNYLGVEAAIKANNKKGREVWLEKFNFFLLKNELKDSAAFRLNFYKKDKDGLPGQNLLRKPIVFKTKVNNGIVEVDLKKYLINTDDDFFISIECLMDKLDKNKLAFSGSILGPSYFKPAAFAPWLKMPYMGLDFNVTVSYQK